MAGAISTGHRAVSSVLVSRSSASPCVALASRSAVGPLPDTHVRHLRHVREHAGVHGVTGQRLEGGDADEPECGLGGHNPDLMARLGEPPQDLARLVGGDPAADAQNYSRASRR
jgi:hypothetical protein